MYVSGIITESFVDGPGIRFTVFFQGCSHQCIGCHNLTTWNFNTGQEMSVNDIINVIQQYPHTSGITLSGGDPFEQDLTELTELCKRIKNINLNIWAYTGYTYEQLYIYLNEHNALGLLEYIDVIVDGPFINDKKTLNLKFRGSSNQRLIDVQKTIKNDKIILL